MAGQQMRQLLEAGVVADHQQGADVPLDVLHDVEQALHLGLVDARLVMRRRLLGQHRRHHLPGLDRALGRRDQHEVRQQQLVGEIAPHDRSGFPSACGKRPVAVGHTGRPVGLGVAQKHEASHEENLAMGKPICEGLPSGGVMLGLDPSISGLRSREPSSARDSRVYASLRPRMTL
ncbi:hypothetical protein BOSEA1005_13180 [Hyphomicrobiales bacterium]|nr:hypothetical protein BOSEA1005_13180 [Hyphomicrobiales bacterium]